MNCITTAVRWKSLTLELSSQGVADFGTLTRKLRKCPMVYIHVEMATRRVLRVGKAESGIHRRWTTAPDGHLSTLEWAMRWGDRYQPYALKFPQYVLFFLQLAGMSTELWFLTCHKKTVKEEEENLIIEYGPIWEEFRGLCKAKGVRKGTRLGQAVSGRDFTDPSLPTLDGLQSRRRWSLRTEETAGTFTVIGTVPHCSGDKSNLPAENGPGLKVLLPKRED